MHTEEEARTKWCPETRIYSLQAELGDGKCSGGWNRHPVTVPRHVSEEVEEPLGARCIASECMHWRWEGRDDGEVIATLRGHVPKHEARGYCGLSGKP